MIMVPAMHQPLAGTEFLPVTELLFDLGTPLSSPGRKCSNSQHVLLPFQGPEFGYVTRGPQKGGVTDLDSFGNLEVSPPVKVGKKKYPLGRILIGDSSYPR